MLPFNCRSNSQLKAVFFFFLFLEVNLAAVFLFLSLVLLTFTGLGLVKFIILHCGDIVSGERWEQSHLNPCKSCGEQTCCPKGQAVHFLYCCTGTRACVVSLGFVQY